MSAGDDDKRLRRTFDRRLAILLGLQAVVAGALGVRLHRLQLVEGEEYRARAEENRAATRYLAPPRGEIVARDGRPIALNRPNYSVSLVREDADDVEETIARLRRLIDLGPREIERLERRLARSPGFVPTPVKTNLDWDAFARLNANAPALPGVVLEAGWARSYPNGAAAAHVVGHVGAVSEAELAADATRDPLLRLPDARIGKTGVERALELQLRGEAGIRRVEVNARGREVRDLAVDPGQPGARIALTLDLDLQDYAMARLGAESGSVVVMDVASGDLLALVSGPSFDPNAFVFGIDTASWNALRDDEREPLRDKATAGHYPPGSTWKMMTALAALEAGLDPRAAVACSGDLRFGDRTFHCWKRSGHGRMRLESGLEESCDVYFYDAAQKAGIARIADMARRFGVGEAPELPLPGVKPGLMPTPDWMRAERGRGWSGGDTLNVGIGQGALLMTPLQLAVMTARLANGRERVAARLVRAVDGVETLPPTPAPLGVDPRHLDLVRRGMAASVNTPRGTAYRSRALGGLAYAGKTGTAQVRSIGMAEREDGVRGNDELPWRLRDHALFVAYAPIEAPRFAIAVVIEHGGGGSAAAAPVARDILMRALHGAEPPLEAYPPEARPEIEARRAAGAARDAGLWTPGAEPGLGFGSGSGSGAFGRARA